MYCLSLACCCMYASVCMSFPSPAVCLLAWVGCLLVLCAVYRTYIKCLQCSCRFGSLIPHMLAQHVKISRVLRTLIILWCDQGVLLRHPTACLPGPQRPAAGVRSRPQAEVPATARAHLARPAQATSRSGRPKCHSVCLRLVWTARQELVQLRQLGQLLPPAQTHPAHAQAQSGNTYPLPMPVALSVTICCNTRLKIAHW